MLFSLGKFVHITAMPTDISVSHSCCFLAYLLGDSTGCFCKLSFIIVGFCPVVINLKTMATEGKKETGKCP